MKKLTHTDIQNMDKRFRTNFINSISGFKSLNLVGTISEAGTTNLAPFNSIVHIGANPALLGMISRPNSVPRDTLENILYSGTWTLNHVNESLYRSAHQCAARFPSETSEFESLGIEPFWSDFKAPYVAASQIKMGLELREKIHIQSNGTHMIIGEVKEIILEDDYIEADGFVNIEKAGSLSVCGLDSYHKTTQLKRLSYPKVGKDPEALK